jgi:hypothetical protein
LRKTEARQGQPGISARLPKEQASKRGRNMRWQQMAIGVLTGLASTLGTLAGLSWHMQSGHRETMECVRPGMTAAQVRHVLGRPRTVWTGAAPLRAALRAEGPALKRPTPTGWRRAFVYRTTVHTRMVVLLDGRGRTTGVLDYGT